MSGPIHLASSNAGKLRELTDMAAGSNIELAALPGFSDLPPAAEDHSSFALNAIEKAEYYSRHTDGPVLADDSGLVVDALGGAPGVHSARYSGADATDRDNNAKLIAEMKGIPEEERTARYICVLALARRGELLAVFSDKCEGLITTEPRGNAGFGYDPYFFFPPLNKTLAQVSEEEKNQVSHRGKAFCKLLQYFKGR